MQSSPLLTLSSPSFDSYSSGKFAEIAARVVEELRAESESDVNRMFGCEIENSAGDDEEERPEVGEELQNDEKDGDDGGDFEFSFVTKDFDSPISADEIFYNGQIRPMFPIFNRDLLLNDSVIESTDSLKPTTPSSIRMPLRKFFIEERDPPSCSSSEADEFDGIPAGTYCVWTPKSPTDSSAGRCKKSNSTGSSKRWKFRDLLYRSNSDGKDVFVFLTPSNFSAKKRDEKIEKACAAPKVAGKAKAKGVRSGEAVTSPAAHYSKKEGDRRRSFLPYRQDLVGFFANVNGLSRNLHPF